MKKKKVVLDVPTLNFLSRYHKCPLVHIFAVGLLTLFIGYDVIF
jgi:hypothetical protein